MPRARLLEEFNTFCQTCVGENIKPYQRRDLRCAFMAGASAMWRVLLNDLVSKEIITYEDIQRIKAIKQEIETFNKDLVEGKI